MLTTGAGELELDGAAQLDQVSGALLDGVALLDEADDHWPQVAEVVGATDLLVVLGAQVPQVSEALVVEAFVVVEALAEEEVVQTAFQG